MQRIKFGIVTKPQGLKGEFRVKPESFNFPFIKDLKKIYIDNKEYEVEKIISRDVFYIFKIKGVNNCESAENFRNIEIYCDFDDEKPLEKGVYYVDDLILCDLILEDGRVLGKIYNILTNAGSADVICYKDNNGNEFMFPFVDNIFINVDLSKKIIKVNSKRLSEILV